MSATTLKVATLSLSPIKASPDENLSTLGRAIELLDDDIDLLVLPELFSTGWVNDKEIAEQVAQPCGGSTMTTLARLAERHRMAIAGSFLSRTGYKLYNRAFFIEPSGDRTFYDKRHLFTMGSEGEILTAGEDTCPIIRYRGWNISMIVCYDLRFPVWCRNRNNAYDLLIVPANWPTERAYAWQHLLIARAIENQCCVIGANRSGSDGRDNYDNNTFIYDALGRSVGTPLARRSAPAPILTASLDLEDVRKIRQKMPVATSTDGYTLL